MMYSVVDIAGVNRISAQIMTQRRRRRSRAWRRRRCRALGEERPLVGASMFGVTTPCVTRGARAAGGARLRGARLPRDRHRRRLDGGADRRRASSPASLDVTTTEFCDELVGGVLVGGARTGSRPAGERGHPAGRLARRARHGQLRAVRDGARALSRPEPLRPQPDDHADADDAGGVPRDRRRSSRASSTPRPGRPRSSSRCGASRRSRPRARSSTTPRPTRRCSPRSASRSTRRRSRCTSSTPTSTTRVRARDGEPAPRADRRRRR